MLWICFEPSTKDPHGLFEWRVQMHDATGGSGAAKPAPAVEPAALASDSAAVPYDRSRFNALDIPIPAHLV